MKVIDIIVHNYFIDLVKHIETKVSKQKNQQSSTEANSSMAFDGKDFLSSLAMKYPTTPSNQSAESSSNSIEDLKKRYSKLMSDL